MQLKVTQLPDHKEDPLYRFTIVEKGVKVAQLFTVPESSIRAYGGQDDQIKAAIDLLKEVFSQEDIASIVEQMEAAFKEIVAK